MALRVWYQTPQSTTINMGTAARPDPENIVVTERVGAQMRFSRLNWDWEKGLLFRDMCVCGFRSGESHSP